MNTDQLQGRRRLYQWSVRLLVLYLIDCYLMFVIIITGDSVIPYHLIHGYAAYVLPFLLAGLLITGFLLHGLLRRGWRLLFLEWLFLLTLGVEIAARSAIFTHLR